MAEEKNCVPTVSKIVEEGQAGENVKDETGQTQTENSEKKEK